MLRSVGLGLSGVTPGSYTNTNLTVDAHGIITVASNGSGGGGSLTVKDIDGTPTVANVNTINFSNGSVTDDGGGVVTVTTGGGGGSPGGSNTQVQYNDSGSFGGDAGFVYNKTTNVLSVINGSSGGTPYSEAHIVIEDDEDAFLQILSTVNGGILFGDAASATVASITYAHGSDNMQINCGGVTTISLLASSLTFNVPFTAPNAYGGDTAIDTANRTLYKSGGNATLLWEDMELNPGLGATSIFNWSPGATTGADYKFDSSRRLVGDGSQLINITAAVPDADYGAIVVSSSGTVWTNGDNTLPSDICVALSDEATELTTGLKLTYYALRDVTMSAVQLEVTDAPTGANLTLQIVINGSTNMFTSDVTIADGTEYTFDAMSFAVTDLDEGDKLEYTVTAVGASFGGAGLKVNLKSNVRT